MKTIDPSAGGGTRSWPWFVAWTFAGALVSLALVGILTIGVFVLPVAALVVVALARTPRTHAGLPGLVSGLALPPLFVAIVNRNGPGVECTTTVESQSCVERLNPWPWFAVAAVLVVTGIALFVALRRSHRPL